MERSLYYQKEYLQKTAKKYEDIFLQHLYKWIPLSFALKYDFRKQTPHNPATRHDIIRINMFRKNLESWSQSPWPCKNMCSCKYFQYKIHKYSVVYHIVILILKDKLRNYVRWESKTRQWTILGLPSPFPSPRYDYRTPPPPKTLWLNSRFLFQI